jgi:hypothetical protein
MECEYTRSNHNSLVSKKKKKEKEKKKRSHQGCHCKGASTHPPTQERATIKNKINPLENMHQLRKAKFLNPKTSTLNPSKKCPHTYMP